MQRHTCYFCTNVVSHKRWSSVRTSGRQAPTLLVPSTLPGSTLDYTPSATIGLCRLPNLLDGVIAVLGSDLMLARSLENSGAKTDLNLSAFRQALPAAPCHDRLFFILLATHIDLYFYLVDPRSA